MQDRLNAIVTWNFYFLLSAKGVCLTLIRLVLLNNTIKSTETFNVDNWEVGMNEWTGLHFTRARVMQKINRSLNTEPIWNIFSGRDFQVSIAICEWECRIYFIR